MGSWWQFLLLSIPLSLPADLDYLEGNGGWLTNKYLALMEEDHCTVEKRDASLTYSQFIDQYAFSRPVVIQGITDNSEFQALCTRNKLLAEFGDRLWMYHSRNTWSTCWSLRTWPPWAVTHSISLETITSQSGAPSSRNTCHLRSGFQAPVGPTALGSPRWFLYPPEKTPEFHPNKTTLSWLLDTYPFLPSEDRPVECTIHPGEVSPASRGPVSQPAHPLLLKGLVECISLERQRLCVQREKGESLVLHKQQGP
ncbi:jmjC domain-containing protein 8 isoform X3 [Dermochelys coriacea]|uniref:jmjC domain-containing protein 8 isoform X3 n=1 Tax=Dermochelys coriacea TaxID=27794 RepID=UPI001CA9A741|nr:jmjC domain-containing protein 8 isoform X3 [Dermochelys coriacea]